MRENNFIGVGGLVVRDGAYLLVRHAYGEYKDWWILPGGYVKDGEALHEAVEREIREETGVAAETQGVVAVRSRCRGPRTTDCYIVFLMKYGEGEPEADGVEVTDARFFTADELEGADNVIVLSKIIIREHQRETLRFLSRNTMHDPYHADCDEVQLFL